MIDEQPIGLAIRAAALNQRAEDLLDEARGSSCFLERDALVVEAWACRRALALMREEAS